MSLVSSIRDVHLLRRALRHLLATTPRNHGRNRPRSAIRPSFRHAVNDASCPAASAAVGSCSIASARRKAGSISGLSKSANVDSPTGNDLISTTCCMSHLFLSRDSRFVTPRIRLFCAKRVYREHAYTGFAQKWWLSPTCSSRASGDFFFLDQSKVARNVEAEVPGKEA